MVSLCAKAADHMAMAPKNSLVQKPVYEMSPRYSENNSSRIHPPVNIHARLSTYGFSHYPE
jgi:hypothetical protein